MRILFLTPQLPHPPHKGTAIRNFHLLKNLARHHELSLLTFGDPKQAADCAELRPFCAEIEVVPLPPRRQIDRLVDLPFSGKPDLVERLRSSEMIGRLRAMIDRRPFDLVQIEGLEMAGHWRALSGSSALPPAILDDHNAEYVLQQRAFQIDLRSPARWRGALYSLLQWQKLVRYERRFCRTVAGIVAASEHDRAALLALDPKLNIAVVPNGVDTDHFQPEPPPREEGLRVIFTGTMDFRPNVDGVCWFSSAVWPRVVGCIPEATLYIVGREPKPAVKRLEEGECIVVTGAVSDVRPYLAAASVAVVPLRIGGGSRLKVLEAMAAGLPVVSTTIGCEGIAVTPETAVIADDPESFAQAIVRLLTDPGCRARLATAARDLVVREYDWREIEPRLERFYENVLTR